MFRLTKAYYENSDNQNKAVQLSTEIADCLMQSGYHVGSNVAIAAYLLHKASQYNNPFGITINSIAEGAMDVNDDIKQLANKCFSEDVWQRLLKLVMRYSPEDFAMAAIMPVNENDQKEAMTTPNSILKLANNLLAVEANELVADVCCGSGTYLVNAALEENQAHYSGFEINPEIGSIAAMRAELIDADVQVTICDAFSLTDNKDTPKFNKIFANYPFGWKLKNLGIGANYLEHLADECPGLSKATSSDWVFNALLCDLLSETGKAVGIMTNGSTSNSIDAPVRKYFVEHKMVECVISLPNRMFSSTNIPTTMIVLSHNNDRVRMIDATKLCQQGRRQNEFSEQDIAAIIDALTANSEYSKELSIDELRQNEYCLSISRYAKDNLSFSNGVSFESVIQSITRGAPCTASQLDEMVSDTETNMQYLMLANIQNGMIDDKLPYLSAIDPKYSKYCLKNNSLILSKNGFPYKVAVASVEDGHFILANGNLYIIELDETKANPYYVKAFFESEQGLAVLKSITVGATIPNIGVDKLKKVQIPLPSMEEQDRIAQKYQAALDEITEIKLSLEKAIDKLHHVFDDECG